jgi:NADPH:quinone reductase-like Zn-dependent oxidoreductase
METSKKMKAIHLLSPNKLALVELPIPKPKKGEVLIKMAFAPINPSDMGFLTGNYGMEKPYPVVPGLEGSGVVVENGGGFYGKILMNKNVACVASAKYDGTWAEYMVTDATRCIDLKKNVPLEQGSMFFVNPLTAVYFIDMAKKGTFKTIVMSAAGSALAKMVLNLAKQEDIKFIGLVRKNEQIEPLQKLGAKKVINITSENFEDKLKETAINDGKVLYLDCVAGGSLPYEILYCLPDYSKMIIYGKMEQSLKGDIEPTELNVHHYAIEGFWMGKKADELSLIQSYLMTRKVNNMLAGGFETTIANQFRLDDFEKAIATYNKIYTGKLLFDIAS